jgi:hypothetical protein
MEVSPEIWKANDGVDKPTSYYVQAFLLYLVCMMPVVYLMEYIPSVHMEKGKS